jgi:hypothetical protein
MPVKRNKVPKGPNPTMKIHPEGHQFTKQTEQATETGTSSVSLVKNSKGVNIGVKVYDQNPIIAEELAVEIFNRLDKKYEQ